MYQLVRPSVVVSSLPPRGEKQNTLHVEKHCEIVCLSPDHIEYVCTT